MPFAVCPSCRERFYSASPWGLDGSCPRCQGPLGGAVAVEEAPPASEERPADARPPQADPPARRSRFER